MVIENWTNNTVDLEEIEKTFNFYYPNFDIANKLYLTSIDATSFMLRAKFGDVKKSLRKYLETSQDLNDDWVDCDFMYFSFQMAKEEWVIDRFNTRCLHYELNKDCESQITDTGDYTGLLEVHQKHISFDQPKDYLKECNKLLEKGLKDLKFVCEIFSKFGLREKLEKIQEMKNNLEDLQKKTAKSIATLISMRKDFD